MKSTTNAVSTTVLCIADVVIRQDEEGRYCLNDLHQASGSIAKDKPYEFLRSKSGVEIVQALDMEGAEAEQDEAHKHSKNYDVKTVFPAVKTVDGRAGGTYAVLEVAVAYANWLSATFYLKVIRTFIAVQSGKTLHNHLSELSIQDWGRLINTRIRLMKELSRCDDVGVAGGIYANILHVSMRLGIATDPLKKLCPGVRHQQLSFHDLEGGAA